MNQRSEWTSPEKRGPSETLPWRNARSPLQADQKGHPTMPQVSQNRRRTLRGARCDE